MEEKSLKILEFDKVLERLSLHASSSPGREYCLKLRPSSSSRHITAWQKNTSDAVKRIRLSAGSPSFSGLIFIDDILKRLDIGASLSAGELLSVSNILSAAERVKHYDRGSLEHEDSLSEMFSMIEPASVINKSIKASVIDEETIADDASPELYSIRRSIAKTESDIHGSMSSRLNALRDYLTDAVITQRDGRWCLPVRAEYKSKVPGIVHDASSTGMTLFIEPQSVVDLSNSLKELKLKEQREMEKVLAALSARLMPYTDAISDDIKILSRLDMIFAKALYSYELNGAEPLFSGNREISFKEARHPLIDPEKAVPIDVSLGKDYDLLIVTGPNTGGKTVSLKTTGLLTLMAQSGLHIPAAEGSCSGIFKDIYADIGDEQSIEQSLSTFSSHMTNTVRILEKADMRSLCLFDELGSGTDPTEGAALGISILDFLLKKRIRTMATTHYAEIKIYALETNRVENAGCEFDIDSLKPTYRLLTGIPGRSNAFAISERLGLPAGIIADARLRLSAENESFEDVIQKLNEDRTGAEKAREEAEKLKAEAEALRDKLKEREARLEKNRDKILDDARKEAQRILKQAKETADEAIKNINSVKTPEGHAKAEKEREKLRKGIENTSSGERLSGKGPSRPVSPKRIKAGDRVLVMPMGGAAATVLTLPDKDNNITVQIGFMRSKINVRDIELAEDGAGAAQSPAKKKKVSDAAVSYSSVGPKSLSVSPEVNLIGMTTDEAAFELEKYLDDAYLAGLPEARIVHGRGTGALKNMVHGRLKKIKYIESFRLGVFGEGGTGVTIAKFRQ